MLTIATNEAHKALNEARRHHDEGSPIAAVGALERARAFALVLPGRAAEPILRRINRLHDTILDSLVVSIPEPFPALGVVL